MVQCSAVQYCVLVLCCVVLWCVVNDWAADRGVLVQCSTVQYSQCSILESIEVQLCIVLHSACILFPDGCTALFNDPGS